MSLTDAMSNQFNAVYVTIDDVQVHMKSNSNGSAQDDEDKLIIQTSTITNENG